jgi:predicted phosphodiesterase
MEKDPSNDQEHINKMLGDMGIDLKNVASGNVGFHVGYIKNSDGEIEYTKPLPSVKPSEPNTLDRENFISQAAPTIIRPSRSRGKIDRKEKKALIITDTQIPFHDPNALSIIQQIAKDNKPDQICIVGDILDFPTLSSFMTEDPHKNTLVSSLDTTHQLLAGLRADNPNAKIELLEGNHEYRLRRFIGDKACELYGIRRADRPRERSVLDLSFLLRLDELEANWHDGYPNGRLWINDRLKVIHGNTVKQLGKTVLAALKNDDTSTIMGHIHRFEMAQRTVPGRHAGRLIMAASFGTLSSITGAVPSHHSSVDGLGRQMKHIEQWQQGAGWVTYNEGDKPFDIQPITINTFDNYHTKFNGKIYEA